MARQYTNVDTPALRRWLRDLRKAQKRAQKDAAALEKKLQAAQKNITSLGEMMRPLETELQVREPKETPYVAD